MGTEIDPYCIGLRLLSYRLLYLIRKEYSCVEMLFMLKIDLEVVVSLQVSDLG